MPKRSGLGRGLDALIPQTSTPSQSESGPVEVAVERIVPNPHQPRQYFDPAKLEELAQSISEHGLIQPVVLTQNEDTAGQYQIIAGERRWRASQLAGLSHIPAFIKETTPQQMLELALVENIQRADLNPLEEAQAYAQLMEEFGLTQEVLAKRVGKSRTAVANTLRLLKLPDELKQALADEKITEGHARALLSLSKIRQQRDALNTVIQRGLNVRQTEAFVRQLTQPQPKKEKPSLTTNEKDMLQRFQKKLSTKVEMNRSSDDESGRITIHFYTQEELQAIFEAILGDEKSM